MTVFSTNLMHRFWRFADRASQYIISVINRLDAQNFCFTISLFHVSTCFEHMCSSSGGQNCITQPLVSSHLFQYDDTRGCVMQFWPPDNEHMCSKHVDAWNKLIVKQKFCASSWLITETKKLMQRFFIVYIYCAPLHVSSTIMLIFRRINCISTASGIATLFRWLFSTQVTRVLA